jgi:hypothetical protein
MVGWLYHPVVLGLLAVAAGVGLGVAWDAWQKRRGQKR